MLLAQAESAFDLTSLLPLLLIGAFVWFIMIRPQRKRAAERKNMMSSLSVGDDIVTIGGIHGRVDALTDDWVDLLVTEDVVIRVTRQAIGSIKSGEGASDQEPLGDDDVSAELVEETDPDWPVDDATN